MQLQPELLKFNRPGAMLSRNEAAFLTLIAHELRNPLQGLFGAAEVLMADRQPSADDSVMHEIYESSRCHLLNLVEDLENAVVLADLRTADAPFVHGTSSLDDVLGLVQTEGGSFAVPYHVSISPPPRNLGSVAGDWVFLKKALLCLVKIAVRLSDPGEQVEVWAQALPEEVGITIESRGASIAEADLARFFEVPALSTSVKAVGHLGLSPVLASRILTLLGGIVQVRNTTAGGVTFHILLPRRPLPGQGG